MLSAMLSPKPLARSLQNPPPNTSIRTQRRSELAATLPPSQRLSPLFHPSPAEATTPALARLTPPIEQVPSRNTQRRKAAERADALRGATREKRTPPDWIDEGETDRFRLSSPARQASPAVVVCDRELLFDS